jgi:hypothetical protein
MSIRERAWRVQLDDDGQYRRRLGGVQGASRRWDEELWGLLCQLKTVTKNVGRIRGAGVVFTFASAVADERLSL